MSIFRKSKPEITQFTCPATGEVCNYDLFCRTTKRLIEGGDHHVSEDSLAKYPELAPVADILDTEFCSEVVAIALSNIARNAPTGSYVRSAAEKLAQERLTQRAQINYSMPQQLRLF